MFDSLNLSIKTNISLLLSGSRLESVNLPPVGDSLITESIFDSVNLLLCLVFTLLFSKSLYDLVNLSALAICTHLAVCREQAEHLGKRFN